MDDQLQFITLATPIRRFRWPKVRMMMHLVQRRETAITFRERILPHPALRRLVHRLIGMPDEAHPWTAPFEEQVKRLQFLHMARWYVIPRLPGEPRLGGPALNFFVTHFDGGAPDYIGSFVDGFGVYGMSTQWGETPGWPTKDATVEKLIGFAIRHALVHQHLFRAYGQLTTGDVRHLVRVDRELRSFHIETDGLPPEAWAREFSALVTRLQGSLGLAAGRIERDHMVGCQEGAVRGKLWGFLAFSALSHDDATDVAAAIQALPGRPQPDGSVTPGVSPFARVPGTHMARLSVIERYWNEQVGDHVPLRRAYVMFAAEFQAPSPERAVDGPDGRQLGTDFEGAVRAYLGVAYDALGPDMVKHIWGKCDGSPARASSGGIDPRTRFVDFFAMDGRRAPSQLHRPDMEFMDYPVTTTGDVARSAETHRRFEHLLFSAGRRPPDELQGAFRDLVNDLPGVSPP